LLLAYYVEWHMREAWQELMFGIYVIRTGIPKRTMSSGVKWCATTRL